MERRWSKISKEWKVAVGLAGILVYFFLLSHRGLGAYFIGDDVHNLVALHGYWRRPWWQNGLEALLVVTPTYRPMGDVFYRALYGLFGFHPLPFRAVCFALMVLNLGLFWRLALLLSHRREAALLGTLVFSFHAALHDLYFSSGTVYDILCVCFTLAALNRYIRIRASGRELQARDIVIVLLLYGAALDSKEMAVSLPLALVLYEFIVARQIPRGRWLRRALPALLTGVLTAAFLAVKVPDLSNNPYYRPQHSTAYLLSNVSHYVGVLLYREQPFGPGWLLALAALAALACLAVRRPVALFGLCYGFVALLPIAPVPTREGFVLYLPLAGFALFLGELLAAARQRAQSLLSAGAGRPLRESFGQAGFFVVLAAGLWVADSRHAADPNSGTEREGAVMRDTVRLMQASHPTFAPGTCLFFLDDPLPKNLFTLLLLMQAAYHDPSLCVERQNNLATPVDPAQYAIFDYVVSVRDGEWKERRLPPTHWEGAAVPVVFTPSTVEGGQQIQMRVGTYSDAAVDIAYQGTFPFSKTHGIALRWAELGRDGVATIPIENGQDREAVQITAVRVAGGVWQRAYGGFVVR